MSSLRIFHISESGDIEKFVPRPSPSYFENLDRNVVFGIEERLLHHYLLPRDCPRVAYYATTRTTKYDAKIFLSSTVQFVVCIEAQWLPVIKNTTIYCYEFHSDQFIVLDECAGYYVSYEEVVPHSVERIDNILDKWERLNSVELRIVPSLWNLTTQIRQSSLNYSFIRMKNAQTTR